MREPSEITPAPARPPPGCPLWREVADVAFSDRISLVAAGCAFYAMLALFPALSLILSFYGIWFDPLSVEPQLEVLYRLLPEASYNLIAGRVHQLVATPRETLGLSVLIGGAIALWGSSAGIRALLGALNLAYHQPEARGTLAFYATALLLTVGAILAVTVGLGFLVALPAILDALGFPPRDALMVRGMSLMLLLFAVLIAIGALYRFGPARPPTHWRLLSAGSVLATLLWVVASAAFSLYVSNFATYDATYGPLGAAAALLTWLYVTVYLILLGAELDAALARRRAAPG